MIVSNVDSGVTYQMVYIMIGITYALFSFYAYFAMKEIRTEDNSQEISNKKDERFLTVLQNGLRIISQEPQILFAVIAIA
jgi:Na+/melibiose symporter-like transporter